MSMHPPSASRIALSTSPASGGGNRGGGLLFVFVLVAAALGIVPVGAQTGVYLGQTVNLVVSSSAGGGYDIMGRPIAKYPGKHIQGNPRVIVSNMPGAGGLTSMNYFYRNAPKDGTYVGGMQNNLPFEPLLGTKEAIYDPT